MTRLPSFLAILAALSVSGLAASPAFSDEEVGADSPAVSALPWNRAFTVRDEAPDADTSFIPLNSKSVAIPAGRSWGVTVNLDVKDKIYENMDRVSAGAYFDISPRVRLGGSLSFSAPGELRVSTPRDRVVPSVPSVTGENEPAVRIESSIKF